MNQVELVELKVPVSLKSDNGTSIDMPTLISQTDINNNGTYKNCVSHLMNSHLIDIIGSGQNDRSREDLMENQENTKIPMWYRVLGAILCIAFWFLFLKMIV